MWRPSGSGTRATPHAPPSTVARTSIVPSPPSATGSSSTSSSSTRRRPVATRPAASVAGRTPLRLAGDASASMVLLFQTPFELLRRLVLGLGRGQLPEGCNRDPLPGEEDQPAGDAAGGLARLQADV